MKRTATLLLGIVVMLGLMAGAVLAVNGDDGTLTGCLTPGGTLTNVAEGDEPARPCTGQTTEVSWNQEGPPGPAGDDADVTVIASPEDHGPASGSYAVAEAVDTVALPEGSWKITATGAVTLDGDPVAQNCGLRVEDESGTDTMLAKQNPAVGGEDGRVGFSVVGALTVGEGDEVDVELVCYPELPFEHNIVAIGG